MFNLANRQFLITQPRIALKKSTLLAGLKIKTFKKIDMTSLEDITRFISQLKSNKSNKPKRSVCNGR